MCLGHFASLAYAPMARMSPVGPCRLCGSRGPLWSRESEIQFVKSVKAVSPIASGICVE